MTKTTTKPQAADLREALEIMRTAFAGYAETEMHDEALAIAKEALASQPTPSAVGEDVREALTPAQLEAAIDALNFCLADDWDDSSHKHSPAVYERALSKLQALQGRTVSALAAPAQQPLDATLREKVAARLYDFYVDDEQDKDAFPWAEAPSSIKLAFANRAEEVIALAQPQAINAGEDAS